MYISFPLLENLSPEAKNYIVNFFYINKFIDCIYSFHLQVQWISFYIRNYNFPTIIRNCITLPGNMRNCYPPVSMGMMRFSIGIWKQKSIQVFNNHNFYSPWLSVGNAHVSGISPSRLQIWSIRFQHLLRYFFFSFQVHYPLNRLYEDSHYHTLTESNGQILQHKISRIYSFRPLKRPHR